jgi:hypothetical protein
MIVLSWIFLLTYLFFGVIIAEKILDWFAND